MPLSQTQFFATDWRRGPDNKLPGVLETAGGANAANPTAFSATAPSSMITVQGWRGGRFRFLGDTAGDANNYVFFAIDISTESGAKMYMATEIGGVATVCGTATGVANSLVLAAELWADEVVWTPTAYGTDLLNYVSGNVEAKTSTDNTKGELLYSDFGNIFGIVVAQENAGTNPQGFIYKLDR